MLDDDPPCLCGRVLERVFFHVGIFSVQGHHPVRDDDRDHFLSARGGDDPGYREILAVRDEPFIVLGEELDERVTRVRAIVEYRDRPCGKLHPRRVREFRAEHRVDAPSGRGFLAGENRNLLGLHRRLDERNHRALLPRERHGTLHRKLELLARSPRDSGLDDARGKHFLLLRAPRSHRFRHRGSRRRTGVFSVVISERLFRHRVTRRDGAEPRIIGFRLGDSRDRKRNDRSGKVKRRVEVLYERDGLPGHEGKLDVGPVHVARVVDDRPTLEDRFLPREVKPIRGLPYRRGDNITDGNLARSLSGKDHAEHAGLRVARGKYEIKRARKVVGNLFVGEAERRDLGEREHANPVLGEKGDIRRGRGSRVASVGALRGYRARFNPDNPPGDGVRDAHDELRAPKPVKDLRDSRMARKVDLEALERLREGIRRGIHHGRGRGRGVVYDKRLQDVVNRRHGKGKGGLDVSRHRAPVLEIAHSRGVQRDLHDRDVGLLRDLGN